MVRRLVRRPRSWPRSPTSNEAGSRSLNHRGSCASRRLLGVHELGERMDVAMSVAVPKGTPAERIAKLNGAINQALKDPEVAKGFATVGIAPEMASGAEATQVVQKDQQRWDELAKKANLALD
ncbi:tripartite tricarboxylate transporter substrate-binding protein [Pseudacidovorax sp. NFM-22]|uniref:tripartite tricarboxylate transporter substrate-binding protein n=1 Tax=Pseudacidovorax sp. NFM-22 TaxID=2744469 RepID=UPI00351CF490